tara:strand:- start:596 stop:1675 length:1080 start_codon:yes stop_codon:yes gene_type:complete
MGFAGQLFDKPGSGGFTLKKAAELQNKSKNQNVIKPKNTNTNSSTTQNNQRSSTGRRGGGGFESYRYPNKMLTNSTDYLKIKIVEYIPQKFGKKAGEKNGGGESSTKPKKTLMQTMESGFQMETVSSRVKKQKALAQVILPIPQSITDSNGVSWGDSTMNPIEAIGYKAARSGMQGDFSAIQNMEGFGEIDPSVKEAVLSSLAAAAVGKSAGEMTARSTGQVMNPNLEVIFQGVQTRSFGFAFSFSPRNLSEANQVKQIIRLFKKHSAAKGASGNGFFISSPDIFILEYMKGNSAHPFLNIFKPMVINSIAMDYTGNGTYSTFHDGTPTLMNMTLNLQELNPIYAEHYDSGEGTRGVGF